MYLEKRLWPSGSIVLVSDMPVESIGLKHLIGLRFASCSVVELSRPEDMQADMLPTNVRLIIFMLPYGYEDKLMVLEAVRRVRKVSWSIPVLFIGDDFRVNFLEPQLDFRHTFYLDKAASIEECHESIERLLCQEDSLDWSMSPFAVDESLEVCPRDSVRDLLSWREFQVMQLITAGINQAEVARRLNICPKTVSTYKNRLFAKLKVDTVAELIRLVLRDDRHPRTGKKMVA